MTKINKNFKEASNEQLTHSRKQIMLLSLLNALIITYINIKKIRLLLKVYKYNLIK